MATGDVADGISHRHDHQAESQRRHQVARAADVTHLSGNAAGDKHQNGRTDKLRHILPQIPHSSILLSFPHRGTTYGILPRSDAFVNHNILFFSGSIPKTGKAARSAASPVSFIFSSGRRSGRFRPSYGCPRFRCRRRRRTCLLPGSVQARR